ncbi:putative RNA-directed DNA polymerase from mobile element jockey-like [Apostichopus japonicus]|uniref:Putative RNA-directed DNA polymerase from mobile element jockey-like n=1 Tax=Stichopus japonicus TaxID=307972 RepID=A0A2G8JWW4_STIJA|nr:putative RNA-directed DNA polymerase from mobile element jockey-like [Apostichopus japonicus]
MDLLKDVLLSNLLTFLEYVTNEVDKGYPVDVVYLDFAKAFDKVAHERLVSKIESHGISGSVSAWISAWLNGRRQRVALNGTFLSWLPVKSGVPQGSVLGPSLFLIFINDIDDEISSHVLKFADDTKVFTRIEDEKDALSLQEDINKLHLWVVSEWNALPQSAIDATSINQFKGLLDRHLHCRGVTRAVLSLPSSSTLHLSSDEVGYGNTVTPTTPSPFIIGVKPSDCTFNVTSSGYLTCYIEAVLPIVHPKWIHDEYVSSRITFSQPQLIVRNVGSLFNIYLTSYYEITTNQGYESETDEDWKAYDITASCSVNYEVLGQHKTDVTLHLQKRSPALTEDRIIERFETNMNWQCVIPVSVMSVIIIIFIIIIIIIIIVFAKWHNGKAG